MDHPKAASHVIDQNDRSNGTNDPERDTDAPDEDVVRPKLAVIFVPITRGVPLETLLVLATDVRRVVHLVTQRIIDRL